MTMNLKDTKELFELAKEKGLFIMEVRYCLGYLFGGSRRPFTTEKIAQNGCYGCLLIIIS